MNLFKSKHFQISLPWIFLSIGVVLLYLGIAGEFPEDSKLKEALLAIGHTMLGSGIFTLLLKNMQYIGIIKDELVSIIYGAEHLDKREDIQEIWERTSAAVFKHRFPKINKQITEDVREMYFPTNHVLYYEGFRQTIEIEMVDINTQTIKVKQTTEFTIHPKDAKTKFPLKTAHDLIIKRGYPESFKLLSYKVNNIVRNVKVESKTENNSKEYSFETELKGAEFYKVFIEVEKEYSLLQDNVIGTMKAYIIKDFSLRVHTNNCVEIDFIPVGTLKKFKQSTGAKGSFLEFDLKGIIYPKQGFVMIVKVKE